MSFVIPSAPRTQMNLNCRSCAEEAFLFSEEQVLPTCLWLEKTSHHRVGCALGVGGVRGSGNEGDTGYVMCSC